jgi:hypothetical protein
MSNFRRPPIVPKMTRSNFTPLYPPKDSEPSVWDLCIKQAAPIDQDLIKDWTETLTFLLVFVRCVLLLIKCPVLRSA